MTIDSQNGTRQPQARNWSPEIALNANTARLAKNNPAGPPHWGHEVIKPRCASVFAHSIDIKVAPPHSPPMPTPWIKRTIVRMTAPQMPIVS